MIPVEWKVQWTLNSSLKKVGTCSFRKCILVAVWVQVTECLGLRIFLPESGFLCFSRRFSFNFQMGEGTLGQEFLQKANELPHCRHL